MEARVVVAFIAREWIPQSAIPEQSLFPTVAVAGELRQAKDPTSASPPGFAFIHPGDRCPLPTRQRSAYAPAGDHGAPFDADHHCYPLDCSTAFLPMCRKWMSWQGQYVEASIDWMDASESAIGVGSSAFCQTTSTATTFPANDTAGLSKLVFRAAEGNELDPASVSLGQLNNTASPGADALLMLTEVQRPQHLALHPSPGRCPCRNCQPAHFRHQRRPIRRHHPFRFHVRPLPATRGAFLEFSGNQCRFVRARPLRPPPVSLPRWTVGNGGKQKPSATNR